MQTCCLSVFFNRSNARMIFATFISPKDGVLKWIDINFQIFQLRDIHTVTAQKIKFSIKDFFSNCEQIRRKSLMENFVFCAVCTLRSKRNYS